MYNSNFFFQSIIRETVRDVFTKQTDFQNMTIYNKWNDTRWARKKILGCRWKSNPRPSVHWSDAITNGILRTHGWTGKLWADITSVPRSLLSSRWGLNPRQYMDNIWGFSAHLIVRLRSKARRRKVNLTQNPELLRLNHLNKWDQFTFLGNRPQIQTTVRGLNKVLGLSVLDFFNSGQPTSVSRHRVLITVLGLYHTSVKNKGMKF